MCGFTGFIGPVMGRAALEYSATAMANAIAHRGPDSDGIWTDVNTGFVLAHCRLAIIDVSPAGHQPMVSASGRWVIAFNGEIYNSADIKRDLQCAGQAPGWRGTSDTEVLLAAIDNWGVVKALEKSTGMFAFALWDRATSRLTLARDRLGEKPLYYGWSGATFLFGSDLAALRQHPDWHGEIDRDAISLLLKYNYIPSPHSIYRGISKLAPGTYIELSTTDRDVKMSVYWSAGVAARNGAKDRFLGSASEAVDQAERLIEQAVSGQTIADVPLGAFLSGGIDSSLVVATMQALSSRPVKTFTIGFEDAAYDEAKYAAAIAHHLGTDHTELYVTQRQALEVVPRLASIYSEPFSDSSQIPTFLVSQLARRDVTVVVTGDGGDELFSGYERYSIADRHWPQIDRIPVCVRRPVARAIKSVPPGVWDKIAAVPLSLSSLKRERAGDRLHKLADIMTCQNVDDVYRTLISHWRQPSSIVLGAIEQPCLAGDAPELSNVVRRMMFADLVGYLPGDILTKIDRASMAVSLETRVPLLDHRLVEFSLRLPIEILRRNGEPKWLLTQILERHVPRVLFERPKMGFGVPLATWLRGPLKDWADALIDPARLARDGFLRPAPIREAWTRHLAGSANNAYALWDVLMFQAWLELEQGRHQ